MVEYIQPRAKCPNYELEWFLIISISRFWIESLANWPPLLLVLCDNWQPFNKHRGDRNVDDDEPEIPLNNYIYIENKHEEKKLKEKEIADLFIFWIIICGASRKMVELFLCNL